MTTSMRCTSSAKASSRKKLIMPCQSRAMIEFSLEKTPLYKNLRHSRSDKILMTIWMIHSTPQTTKTTFELVINIPILLQLLTNQLY